MKKITFLLLTILPLLTFGQKTYDFTLGNSVPWIAAGNSTSATQDASGITLEFNAGTPRLDITAGADPYDASILTHLVVTLQNNSTEVGTMSGFFHKNDGDADAGVGTQFLGFDTQVESGLGTYIIDLTSVNYNNDEGDLGGIDDPDVIVGNDTDGIANMEYVGIRFRNATGSALTGDSATNGNIIIKKIEIVEAGTIEKNTYDFTNDNISGFSGDGTITDGGTTLDFNAVGTTATPFLTQNFYSVDSANLNFYMVVDENASNAAFVTLIFKDAGGTNRFYGRQALNIGSPTTIVYNGLDSKSQWTGQITEWSVRFEVENPGATNVNTGTIKISKIGFTNTNQSAVDGSWSDNATWFLGSTPTSTQDVIINNSVTVGVDQIANNVTITSNGTLTFNNGNSLTLTGNLINEDDDPSSVIIRNNSNTFSSLIVQGTVTGAIRHRRHINANPQNDLISPAVLVPFNEFYTEIGARIHTYPDSGIAFGPFDSSAGTYTQYTPTTTTALTQGTGYVAGASGTPDQNFNFHGTVRTDQVDVTISGAGTSPWNLIGNPYPSYVNFDTFYGQLVTDGVLEIGYVSIYGYNGTNWTIWDEDTVTDFDELIAPGQGFFVRSNATGGDVSFMPAMRTTGTGDDFIPLKAANTNSVKASLKLLKNAINYPTNIIFIDGKTRSLDYGGDTAAFAGPDSSAPNIYTNLVEDNNGLELYNQALPYNDFNDVVVPLGVIANSGEQISISLDDTVTTIPSNINVYLEDNATNTWTLLNDGDYTFTPSVELTGTGRFFVHFTSSTLSVEDEFLNGLQVYSTGTKSVMIKGQLNSDANISIFDIRGRKMLQQNLNSLSTINSVNVNNLTTGVYIVRLNNRSQNKVQKIIIK